MKIEDFAHTMRACFFGAAAAVLIIVACEVPRVERIVGHQFALTSTKVDATLDNVTRTSLKVDALVAELASDWRDGEGGLFWDVAASLESETVAARSTAETMQDLHTALMGGKDTTGKDREGLVTQAEALLRVSQDLLVQVNAETTTLSLQIGDTLNPLKASLEHINALTDRLDYQIQAGSPKIEETITDLNAALVSVDKLISNPDIAGTLKHVDSSSESIDAFLLPLRKKISLAKALLEKAFGLIKFTHPL